MYLRDIQGFPDGSVVKNLPADAGDTGSNPDPGRSHMPQSSHCVATTEPLLLRLCSATRKTTTTRSLCTTREQLLLTATRESSHSKEDPAQPKIN